MKKKKISAVSAEKDEYTDFMPKKKEKQVVDVKKLNETYPEVTFEHQGK